MGNELWFKIGVSMWTFRNKKNDNIEYKAETIQKETIITTYDNNEILLEEAQFPIKLYNILKNNICDFILEQETKFASNYSTNKTKILRTK